MSLDVLLVPDLQQSSGGRHLQRVLTQLAIPDAQMPAMLSYAGGAQAVVALSAHAGQRVMACAQSTEVQAAAHAHYLGPFPAPYALSTEYAVAAVHPHADNHDADAHATLVAGRRSGSLSLRTRPASHAPGAGICCRLLNETDTDHDHHQRPKHRH